MGEKSGAGTRAMPDEGTAQQRGAAAVVSHFLYPLLLLGSLQYAITSFNVSHVPWLKDLLGDEAAGYSGECKWDGEWYSRDFYGTHGLQTQEIKVVCPKGDSCHLVVKKTTGDSHVPAGKVTWKTRIMPEPGADSVRGYVHLRGDASDESDFQWGAMSVQAIDCDHLQISGRWSGNFHRVDGGSSPLTPE